MEFDVVDRPEMLVAGLVLRSPALAVEGPRRAKVAAAWDYTKQRELPGPMGTAYVDYAPEINSYLTHLVGYYCTSLDDLLPGDVLGRVPAGRYARFVAGGEDMGDTIVGLWRQIWDAEAAGRLVRSYTGDYEQYPDPNTVEVFVGLADPQGEQE